MRARRLIFFLLLVPSFSSEAQLTGDTLVVAGKQYARSGFHQWLWGRHYRSDWATPVLVPFISLDTVNGGLIAYQSGGGRQTNTLRLRNPNGKEWVIRSIDKRFGRALDDIYRGTFIESLMNDQVSIAQPYAAITIPVMAKAVGVYHTNPVIGFIRKQPALDSFNEEYGDALYLLEQRPDENWEEADNFGNGKNIVGTDKMLGEILEDNDSRIDQKTFIRARLFDMIIGDWGRHEDQWRWIEQETGDEKLFIPIPRDRDQAYTKFDGALLSIALSAAGAGHLESFAPTIKDVETYNYAARNLDRRATNEEPLETWVNAAKDLQSLLTDAVITKAVQMLPPDVFHHSGEEIIRNIRGRRDRLPEYARTYYQFLAGKVEIPGTQKAELFRIRGNENSTTIEIFDLDKTGKAKTNPFYQRTFAAAETREIRVYGIEGEDHYEVDLRNSKTKLRIIGGPSADRYHFSSTAGKITVYDRGNNEFIGKKDGIRLVESGDSSIHRYEYAAFRYDDRGLGPVISYNARDHIHIGIKYGIEKQGWRKEPFAQKHEWALRYSISEEAFSYGYEGIFKQLLGNWDLELNATYDPIRWTNFFGAGNETILEFDERDYNRVRSREAEGYLGLRRGAKHSISFGGLYHSVKVLNDPGRFHTESNPKPVHFFADRFAGARVEYSFNGLNNPVLPTSGMQFQAGGRYLNNLATDSSVLIYGAELNAYVPLGRSFVFYLKSGGGSLTGQPQFYQLHRVGGSRTLRGYRRWRFQGESAFYNQFEMQFIRNVRSRLMNGKAGLIALYDIGRVWQPSETSDRWHSAYGGGIMIAPFNKFSVAVFYAVSREENDISIRISTGF